MFLFVVFGALAALPTAKAEDIALVYALDQDLKSFKDAVGASSSRIEDSRLDLEVVPVGPHRVFAAKLGRGNIPSALTTERVITRCRCAFGISLGVVGSLRPELARKQIYRLGSVVSYQRASATNAGTVLAPEARIEQPLEALPSSFVAAVQKLPAMTAASGDLFVSSTLRDELRRLTGADAVDMNAYGVALTAGQWRLPVLQLRVVSDYADEKATADFADFASTYEGSLGFFAASLLKELPTTGTSARDHEELMKLLE